MRSFPKDTGKALYHFGTVKVGETPVIDVFCCAHPGDSSDKSEEPTLRNMQKRFKKLSVLVHPDKCASDRSSANKAMQKLSRAKEQAEREIRFEEMENGEGTSQLVPPTLIFTLMRTSKEKLLELLLHEEEEKREERECERRRIEEVMQERIFQELRQKNQENLENERERGRMEAASREKETPHEEEWEGQPSLSPEQEQVHQSCEEEMRQEGETDEENISVEDNDNQSPSSLSEHICDDDFDVRAYIAVTLENSSSEGEADDFAAEAETSLPLDRRNMSEFERKKGGRNMVRPPFFRAKESVKNEKSEKSKGGNSC